ncbi:hypothetical protein BX616_001378 [Lobosporangium transversale]|uniref:ATP-dependent DNA helicase n=1 Tax=Lobosporangium transversale TaxID=64571 RepID=A0A1Y2GK04_9FUNG|nr:hypothetical protein BCR41DRAFT_397638 [Lobosporangium transversale]KAF9904185.1 hypothetical protein BX616_001378 [Lobosporangium transversale]ORZ12050.1 hypothetical protein BCR41DRAFT_397638 [Lobosporangium transversale]|eukprot:XP_021879915.1 hypothetical protein BCR41DRAFT_397638 [Lobosporangium transversale]
MALTTDDDFDFDIDLDVLELDREERALLEETSNQNDAHVSGPATNVMHVRNQKDLKPNSTVSSKKNFPVSNQNNPSIAHYFKNTPTVTTTTQAEQDDFAEFGDLQDTDLLLDNDLLDDTSSSSISSAPKTGSNTSFISPSIQQVRAPIPPQQQQPVRFFSIFGGAENRTNTNSNTPVLQKAQTSTNNSLHGFNRQGSSSNVSSYFLNSDASTSSSPTSASTSNSLPTAQLPPNVLPRSDPLNDFAEDIFRSPEARTQPDQPATHHLIDKRAALTWQYPVNYPRRDYQYNIIRRALFTNTLVSLPTGLGKTFIAAVVMLNYFRWFPKSKIIFMAPTKPLVNQQIEACFNVCGIPQDVTVEMTGQQNAEIRKEMWQIKRVIYCTPQVLQNDLKSGICPAEDIVCLVVDEAHRATGRYAYSEVIRQLEPLNRDVRILALTATPGSDIKTVQTVVRNLKIAKIELRTEDSMDLQQYVFKRSVQEMIVPCGKEVGEIRDKFFRMMRPFLDSLVKQNVIRTADPSQLTRFVLLQGRDAFVMNNPGNNARKAYVQKQVGICMGLVHAYELLTIHGIKPFFVNMDPFTNSSNHNATNKNVSGSKKRRGEYDIDYNDDDNRPSLARKAMMEIPDFIRMMDSIRIKMKQSSFVSHPKLERLVGIVVQHFIDHQDEQDILIQARAESAASSSTGVSEDGPLPQTRVMIFANYRESVEEISRVLEHHRPLIKVQSFIGQATAKGKKGISQKEQQKVVADFQKGNHNVLVATSIGEEGLDIGDVDLIVCYDSHSSPIRMLQRMGRTGRKRKGKICLLLAEGQEEQKYRRSQTSYKTVQRAISQGTTIQYYSSSPRILPQGPPPTCDLVHINVPAYVTPTTVRKRRKLGEDNSVQISGPKLQSAFLDSQETARFQQTYRIPKREIRKITFKSACTSLLRGEMKKAATTLDRTYKIGHSSRTIDFVESAKRIAKARVGQSLSAAMVGLPTGEDDVDPYSRRMQALIDRWGPSGLGASDSIPDVVSRFRGKMSSKATKGDDMRNQLSKSHLYMSSTVDDEDIEHLHAQGRQSISGQNTGHRRRLLISDSEDDDDGDNEVYSGRDRDFNSLGNSPVGANRNKPPRLSMKSNSAVSNKNEKWRTTTASYQPLPSPFPSAPKDSAHSYPRSLSDDDIDKEIMGGLDAVFVNYNRDIDKDVNRHEYPNYFDDDHDGYVPDMTPDIEERPGRSTKIPLLKVGVETWSRDQPPKARSKFDFSEQLNPNLLWFKADSKNEKNRDESKHTRGFGPPKDSAGSVKLLDLPPVPPPGQWYRPQSRSHATTIT